MQVFHNIKPDCHVVSGWVLTGGWRLRYGRSDIHGRDAVIGRYADTRVAGRADRSPRGLRSGFGRARSRRRGGTNYTQPGPSVPMRRRSMRRARGRTRRLWPRPVGVGAEADPGRRPRDSHVGRQPRAGGNGLPLRRVDAPSTRGRAVPPAPRGRRCATGAEPRAVRAVYDHRHGPGVNRRTAPIAVWLK